MKQQTAGTGEAASWVLTRIIVPFALIWLLILALIYGASILLRTPRPVELYLAVASLLVIFLAAAFSPMGVAAYFLKNMRALYSRLEWSSTGTGHCEICREEVLREKYTGNLFLLPYAFKTLRHYERAHPDISRPARGARLAFTASVHTYLFSFAVMVGLRNLVDLEVSPLEAIAYFLSAFLPMLAIFYGLLAYILMRKKGAGLGK